jgi:hypothetical protein
MRDAAPLPGLTPEQVVAQLAHRVFGPLQPARTRLVLDYHGLLEHPAAELVEIARRRSVTARTVSNTVAAVRAAGARQPLSSALITAASRPSTPTEDHVGRMRIATTLGLRTPAAAPPATENSLSPGQLAAARTAVRVLAATGPLTLPVLAGAVTRSHRFRTRNTLSDNDLVAALTAVGCTQRDGRWYPPAGVVPPERYRSIVALADGRELTRQQMINILLAAGYSSSSATGRMSSSHPLFQRTGPDRYRLITDS